jgi:hypothetical protein
MSHFWRRLCYGLDVQRSGSVSATSLRTGIHVLLAVLLVLTALRQGWLIGRIWFDGENSPTESESLFALSRVCAGQTLYLDYAHPPHVITAYMPLFYWTTELIARTARNWREMVVVARWSVYVYWVGLGVVIFGAARQMDCARPVALLAALLWGSSELGCEWANSFRPDAAALFFSLATLWVYQRRRAAGNLAASTVLLVVAALFKHTVLAPLVVIVWGEVTDGQLWRAVMTAAVWGAAMAVVVLVAQGMTGGRFALNVFSGLAETGTWISTWALLVTALAVGAAAFWGAILACIGVRPHQAGVMLWKRYFIVSVALAFMRSRIFGAFTNHYLEPFAAGCVLSGVMAQGLLSRARREPVPFANTVWLVTVLGLALALTVEQGWEIFQSVRGGAQWKQFAARLGTFDGPILAEDPYVTVRSGRQPYMIDANKFAHLQRDGKFDDADLLRRIGHGEFVAIISKTPLEASLRPLWAFPPRWLIPMRERYYLDSRYIMPERDSTLYVYRPKTQL